MSKSQRRAQAAKPRNPELAQAMQELRRSSAASPMRNKTKYNRADYRRKRQSGEW